ncbi:MAG: metallophosphoesterase [Bacillota bacterium]
MLLGIISDTHQQHKEAKKAIKQMGQIEQLLHAGDFYEDAMKLAEKLAVPVKAVVGNCDWYLADKPDELVLEFENVKILLTHGHINRVRFGYDNLLERAKKMGVRVAIFGHTHVPVLEERDGVLLFNPGSVATPRGGSKPSFGLLKIYQGKVHGEILSLIE